MVRAPYFDKHGMKKGEWSEEEDKKLKSYIEKNGHSNWRSLPKDAGLSRCGKSCRLRWMNYLRPGVKHGNFTKEEEDIIAVLHKKHGNKWSMMAAQLPGRSDNEIKNHWHTRMKNRVEKDQTDHVYQNEKFWSPETAAIPKECLIERCSFKNQDEVEILLAVLSSDHLPSSCSTRESSSSSLRALDDVVPSDVTAVPEISKPVANFWTDPFLPADNDSCVESSSYKMFSPLGFADDLMTTQASYEDYITDDVFLW